MPISLQLHQGHHEGHPGSPLDPIHCQRKWCCGFSPLCLQALVHGALATVTRDQMLTAVWAFSCFCFNLIFQGIRDHIYIFDHLSYLIDRSSVKASDWGQNFWGNIFNEVSWNPYIPMPEQHFREIGVYYNIFISQSSTFIPSTPWYLGDALHLVLNIPTHHNNHSLLFNTCWPTLIYSFLIFWL